MTQIVSYGLFLLQVFTSDWYQGPEEIFVDTMYHELWVNDGVMTISATATNCVSLYVL